MKWWHMGLEFGHHVWYFSRATCLRLAFHLPLTLLPYFWSIVTLLKKKLPKSRLLLYVTNGLRCQPTFYLACLSWNFECDGPIMLFLGISRNLHYSWGHCLAYNLITKTCESPQSLLFLSKSELTSICLHFSWSGTRVPCLLTKANICRFTLAPILKTTINQI